MSYSEKYKQLENNNNELANLNDNIVKEKIARSFPLASDYLNNSGQFKKALEIIEFKVIELWNSNDTDFTEYCSNYLDIALLLPVPKESLEKIDWIFKIISFGYLGEDWQKVRRFLIDNKNDVVIEPILDKWNLRLLSKIYLAVFYLVKKESWKDLAKAIEIVNDLREEQVEFEKHFLESILDNVEKKAIALDLASLYHLAKAVEIIAKYQNEGNPNDVTEQLQFHFAYAQRYCESSSNIELNLLLQYLQPTFIKLVSNSIWTVAKGINSRVTKFVDSITKANNPVFELLYPQKEAILKQGLLNDANKAVVVNLPTSSGKTLIAEFRILKALNQFSDDRGWVVYTVPTRALVNQIYIRLQKDLSQAPLSLKIEKMSGALELDSFEENILHDSNFDVLITTYEKLNLLIRQGIEEKLGRPLSLVVVDEAHNIEDASRGIGLELMLSTIKKDCKKANYLLLTPEIPNASDIAKWLDENSTSISIGTTDSNVELDENFNSVSIGLNWKPNERMIGEIYSTGNKRSVKTFFKPYLTTKNTLETNQNVCISKYSDDCHFTASELKRKFNLASLVAKDFQAMEGILVIARSPADTYKIADNIYNLLSEVTIEQNQDVRLIQKFVASELGNDFPLVKFLDKGIGVHSAALPDEIKFLLEGLMEAGHLKYLVCTTTIAQGINFPVSAIFMASYAYPYTPHMPTKDFWNLAGRAKSLGVVGIATTSDDDRTKLKKFLKTAADDLVSVLTTMVNDLNDLGDDLNIGQLFYKPEWSNFLQYISHIYTQARDIEEFLSEVELSLRRTYGYRKLSEPDKQKLAQGVKEYAKSINKGWAKLSDSTGFSTETIRHTIMQLKEIDIHKDSWNKNNLFSKESGTLQKLVGIMLKTPEIKKQIEEINATGAGIGNSSVANIINDWVAGKEIKEISKAYFGGEDEKSISNCTRAIYSKIVNSATWGIAAMQQIPNSGIDWNSLTYEEERQFRNLPSMIYYGVNSEEAVLLRKGNVPRSIASNLGRELESEFGKEALKKKPIEINEWLNNLSVDKWQAVIPQNKEINGIEYKKIWKKLVGIE
jgi:replicative superfamily II helicase